MQDKNQCLITQCATATLRARGDMNEVKFGQYSVLINEEVKIIKSL